MNLIRCLLLSILLSFHVVTGFTTTRASGTTAMKRPTTTTVLHQALPQQDDLSTLTSSSSSGENHHKDHHLGTTTSSRASSIALFALRLPSEFGSSSSSVGGVMETALPLPFFNRGAAAADVWFPPEELLPAEPTSTSAAETLLQQQQQREEVSIPLWQLALAGSLATAVGDMAVHPMDSIKTVMQSDMAWQLGLTTNNGQDISFWKTAQYIQQTAGLTGFYHGFRTYATMDAAGGAIKFAVWELWKSQFMAKSDDNDKENSNNNNNLPLLMLGAGLSFLASSSLIVPGELIKQQLQMEQYASLPQAIAGIWATSGLLGFFTGYNGVVYREVPYTMLELGLYEVLKKSAAVAKQQPEKQQPPAWQNMAVAAGTGGVAAFLTTPMDVIKTKLMVDAEYAHATFWETLVSTTQQHGWPALFCGVEARVSWIMPFVCIYLPLYDAIKDQLLQQQQQKRQQAQTRWEVNAKAAATAATTTTTS